MDYKFDVSVVIITWKMKDYLERLLRTVYKYSSKNFEMIIIDNNSQDGTIEMVKKDYSDAVLIFNKENKGVAPARNQGLKIAQGKYVFVIDADMEFVEDTMGALFNFMEENPECGFVGSKLIYADGILQLSCKKFPTIKSLFYRRLETFELIKNSKTLIDHTMADWDHNQVREVDYCIGACQFYRNSVMQEIGYYDENIFYGPEDIDYCLRVWKAGWKVFYYPFSKIIHHEQRITKKSMFNKITFKHLLGLFYFFKKYNLKLSRK